MTLNRMLARRMNYLAVLFITTLITACGGGSSNAPTTNSNTVVQATEQVIQVFAKTGPIIGVVVGDPVQLDGSESYLSSALPQFTTTRAGLTYDWSFTHIPYDSTATLQNADTANPSFVPDLAGVYIAQLTVGGQAVTSQRAIETVVVGPPGATRITGSWIHENLPSTCYSCHTGVVPLSSGSKDIGKSANHVATSNNCEACHAPTSQGFALIPIVDHAEVFGQCSLCHDGVKAIGKSRFHQATEAECSDCHNTVSFLTLDASGKFDHSSITGLCSGCHTGKLAIGMPPTTADNPPGTHPVTKSECGYCHTTQTFSTPYPDHTGQAVVGHQCIECHNSTGTIAKALPADHPDMGVDCQVCHTINSFSMGGVFNHGLVDPLAGPSVVRCDTCHNSTNTSVSTIKAIGTVDDPTPPHPAINSGDCGVCHSAPSNPRDPAYLGFAASAFNHTGITNGCQNCHGNLSASAPNISATGKPAPTATSMHMPTSPDNPGTAGDEDCGNCHSPGTFATGYFDHTDHANGNLPITSGCNACHNNVITVGKLPSHIKTFTTQDCAACHTTDAFKPATFNHASVSSFINTDCAQCHDGNISTGMDITTHIPVPSGQDCFVCHTYTMTNLDGSTAPFKQNTPQYQHVNVITNGIACESCHSGKTQYVTAGAIGKTANHIPALNACAVCHADTNVGGFKSSSTFMNVQHPGITGGCEGCHIAKFLPTANSSNQNIVKNAATHIPTDQDCNSCHTNAAGGFSLGASTFTHKGIINNCVSCHNGSWIAVKGPNNVGALGMTPTTSQGGSHPATTADCLYCHTTTKFTQHSVDHGSPAVTLVRCDSCHFDPTPTKQGIPGARSKKDATPPHPVTTEDCVVCHSPGGSFAGAVFDHSKINLTAQRCDSCHNGINATGTVDDPTPPHPSTNGKDCGACHTPGGSFAGAKYDHTGIVNNCASCHDGNTARGQIPPPNHVPTNEDCSVCHQTTGFLPATFSHAGIVGNCSSCHDAGFATGKPANHVVTIKDCGICHSIGTTFAGTTIDHSSTDVTSKKCADCHNGSVLGALSKADAPSPGHLTTSLDCGSCHTTGTFVGGGWVHGPETAHVCKNCHDYNGNNSTPRSVGHINTPEQCDVCHSTKAWAPTTFSHASNSSFTVHKLGSHRKALSCSNCHGSVIAGGAGMQWLPSKKPQYAPDCAACHANNFRSRSRHNGGRGGTVAQNKNCGASGCHKVSSRSFD